MDIRLATIQVIKDIQPIPEADAIQVAQILGWKVVIRKGEFNVGDKCVYCQIDTVLPNKQEFDFLRKVNFRIRTVRMRKQVSQGIAFPLSIIPAGNYEVDQDVTELVGIQKYVKPIPTCLGGLMKGGFPSHTPRTDEILLQSVPGVIDEIMGKEVYITIKCDGTSATFSNFQGEIDVCSRENSWKDTESNLYWKMFKKYKIDKTLNKEMNISIQAEICGPSIQKNHLDLLEQQIFVFDIYDITRARYLDYQDMKQFCDVYKLPTVPLLQVTNFSFTIDQLVEMAKGTYESGKNREGIVIRPTVVTYSPTLDKMYSRGRLSFKVMNNVFLEKEKE